jgi:hypothetical protein
VTDPQEREKLIAVAEQFVRDVDVGQRLRLSMRTVEVQKARDLVRGLLALLQPLPPSQPSAVPLAHYEGCVCGGVSDQTGKSYCLNPFVKVVK